MIIIGRTTFPVLFLEPLALLRNQNICLCLRHAGLPGLVRDGYDLVRLSQSSTSGLTEELQKVNVCGTKVDCVSNLMEEW